MAENAAMQQQVDVREVKKLLIKYKSVLETEEAFENFKGKFLKILIHTYEMGGHTLTEQDKRNLEHGLGAFMAMEIRKAEMEERILQRVSG